MLSSWRKPWRIAAFLLILAMISTLIAVLVWPSLFEFLPDSLLTAFRPSPGPELKMHSVFGVVTLDGEPIAEGELRFVPMNGKLNPDIAKIKYGKYVAQVKDGEHKVQIRALKEGVQYVPARFNDDTELRFVAEEGEHPFHLVSKSK